MPGGLALSGSIKEFNAENTDAMQEKVIAGSLNYDALCSKNGITIAKHGIKDCTSEDTMNTLSGFDHIDTFYVKTNPDKEKTIFKSFPL